MTLGQCVISAAAVCETLFEGTADYCMIVCEQCLPVNREQILLLPWTQRPGGSKFAPKNPSLKLHLSLLICALGAELQLVVSHESTSPSATQVLLPVVAAWNIQSFAKPNYLALPSLGTLRRTAEWHCLRIVIWLILPVVICLSQRLSHACMDNRGNSRANTCWLA
ncbi:hypothetical protein FGO68_gene4565 [Halteria grandinella]|uniref:Uncharacterized protein n=1 Tax=Halteria grandinella TaxID=5974 RepID=A0A8J8SV17_HALGN|nr:hypothetical protein FGO68_gene4565 [Halteria grandinella]